MKSKIPYKKDLTFITKEEENKINEDNKYENQKRHINLMNEKIANEISSHIAFNSERYIIYDIIYDIKEYTTYKPLQKKLLEYAQQSLNDKGYTNYMSKTGVCEKKLVILLDDNSKDYADNEVKRIKKFNLKRELIIIGIMLFMIIFFGFVLFNCGIKGCDIK